MPEAFDPYYSWLGIPPAEQPADYYRLLGLSRFENNSEVIANAAERQIRHVRTFQLGENAVRSQTLLSELAEARSCLMDSTRKAIYDEQLAARMSGLNPPPVASPIPAATSTSQRPRQRLPRSPQVEVVKIVVGGVAGLTIGVLLLWYGFGMDVLGVMESRNDRLAKRVTQNDAEVRRTPPRKEETRQDDTREPTEPEPDVRPETDSADPTSTESTPLPPPDEGTPTPSSDSLDETRGSIVDAQASTAPILPAELAAKDVIVHLTFEPETISREGGKTFVRDQSGCGNHASIHGPSIQEGRVGSAMRFDGIDDYVDFPFLRDDLTKGLKELSICFWAKHEPPPKFGFLFDVGLVASKSISVFSREGKIYSFSLPTEYGGVTLDSNPVATAEWHHISAVWTGSEQRIYVDGVLDTLAPTRVGLSLTPETVYEYSAHLGMQSKPDAPDKLMTTIRNVPSTVV